MSDSINWKTSPVIKPKEQQSRKALLSSDINDQIDHFLGKGGSIEVFENKDYPPAYRARFSEG